MSRKHESPARSAGRGPVPLPTNVDISDPYRPREIGWHIPDVPGGVPQSNDVYVDADGLIYLVDRFDGALEILEPDGV